MPTVLIFEEESAVADPLEMVLTERGYHAVTDANGPQGPERLAQGLHPDRVISDDMMTVLE